MLITFNSLFWFAAALRSLWKNKSSALLDPVFHIGVFTVLFFSSIPDTASDEVGMVLIITSILILVGVNGGLERRGFQKNGTVQGVPERVKTLFLIMCILFVLALFVFYFKQGITSFVLSTRFLLNAQKDSVSSFLWAFRFMPLWGLIIGRIWFNSDGSRKIIKVLWIILFGMFFFLDYFTGARGDVLELLLSVIIVDVWQGMRLGVDFVKKRKKFYFALSFVSAGLILFLTFYRFQTFSSFGEMMSAASQTVTDFNSNKLISDRSITENQDIGYLITNYLDSPAYMQGIYAQIVNPIPRMIWDDKPLTFGQRLGYERTGADVVGLSWGMTAGIAGEAIFNGGYIGLLVFPLLFGLLFRVIKKTLMKSPSVLKNVSALLFLSHSYLIIRGEWMVGINEPLYACLLGVLVFKSASFLSRVFSNQSRYAPRRPILINPNLQR